MNQYDLTYATASGTYQRLLQTVDGVVYDGLGKTFSGVTGYYIQDPPAPISPALGSRWYDLSTGLEYVYIKTGDNSQWVTSGIYVS
jgi:hypothetical protein